MIAGVNPRDRRLLGLALLGLVLLAVFLVAGPHDALHAGGQVDCQLCFVHATETPEPVRVERPVLCVAHLEEPEDANFEDEWDWSACEPRAPPARV